MKTRDFERFLSQEGYVLISNGSHKKWVKNAHSVMVVHAREMNKMVARRLMKEIERNKNSVI